MVTWRANLEKYMAAWPAEFAPTDDVNIAVPIGKRSDIGHSNKRPRRSISPIPGTSSFLNAMPVAMISARQPISAASASVRLE